MKKNILKNNFVQTVISSVICILLGLFIGYVVLLFINPGGAWNGILTVIKNFFTFSRAPMRLKNLGNTLVKTAPLLMCSLSILFCYKVGLFNIGTAGQYTLGAGAALYCALKLGMPWYTCIIAAMVAGALSGAVVGTLKAYCNVNEVISGIMMNWMSLYSVNMLLSQVKEPTSPYTVNLSAQNPSALIPSLGLEKFFNGNQYVTIAIPISLIFAFVIWIVLDKTKFGYELKATGFNKNAAKYAGMSEKRNVIVTLAIGGALAGIGAALLYLTGIQQWECSQSSVPGMGFDGIAVAFLGGLNPIGAIFSSYFIQHITLGGAYVDKTMYCSQISDLIASIIIYLCGFVLFMKLSITKWVDRREDAKMLEMHGGEKSPAKGGKK